MSTFQNNGRFKIITRNEIILRYTYDLLKSLNYEIEESIDGLIGYRFVAFYCDEDGAVIVSSNQDIFNTINSWVAITLFDLLRIKENHE